MIFLRIGLLIGIHSIVCGSDRLGSVMEFVKDVDQVYIPKKVTRGPF